MFLAGVVEVNAFPKAALLRFTPWPWFEHPNIIYLKDGHSTIELWLTLF